MTYRTLSNGLVQIVKWAKRRHKDENPRDFYYEYYPGIPRYELSLVDPGLYQCLRRRKLIDKIEQPKIPRQVPAWDKEGAYSFYRKQHMGNGRSDIKKINSKLYDALRAQGTISKIPRRHRDIPYVGSPKRPYTKNLEIYLNRFPDCPRGQLSKNQFALYLAMWYEGTLKHVPRKVDLEV